MIYRVGSGYMQDFFLNKMPLTIWERHLRTIPDVHVASILHHTYHIFVPRLAACLSFGVFEANKRSCLILSNCKQLHVVSVRVTFAVFILEKKLMMSVHRSTSEQSKRN